MHTEARMPRPPVVDIHESRIGETVINNYSGRSLGQAISLFRNVTAFEKVVIMPDLNPGRTEIPTGSSVELRASKVPNWRELVLSDIGCGMQVLETQLNWDQFNAMYPIWDDLYPKLKKNKGGLGDLGSGNHFVDAAVDDAESVYFVIHTGSRNQAATAAPLVNSPEDFDNRYAEIQAWARQNRDTVRDMLTEGFGETRLLFDQPHNTFVQEGDKVVIYKGTVNLQPRMQSIIPSSMDGDMVIIEGVEREMEKINHTIAHGTGRIKSRGDSKLDALTYDFKALRRRVHIPEAIKDESISTENPSCYRTLDECLDEISDLVVVKNRLTPVAYIGQI